MLTNEEILQAVDAASLANGPGSFVLAVGRAIEAKVLAKLHVPYAQGKTCRTCMHLDTDPRQAPCVTCRDFAGWKGTDGVAPSQAPEQPLPYWEPCNPGCDPEFNGQRDRHCAKLCKNARDALGVATGQPAHSKSEYKRRVAQGDPNVLPPAQQWLEAAKEAQAGFADALTSGVEGRERAEPVRMRFGKRDDAADQAQRADGVRAVDACCGHTMPHGFRCTGCPHAKPGDTLVPRQHEDPNPPPEGNDGIQGSAYNPAGFPASLAPGVMVCATEQDCTGMPWCRINGKCQRTAGVKEVGRG